MTVESWYDSLVAAFSCGVAAVVVFCLSQIVWLQDICAHIILMPFSG